MFFGNSISEVIATFLQSSDSPFKAELSTLIVPSTTRPSAGILSPDCKTTISPTTISSITTSLRTPSRYVLINSFLILALVFR